MQILITGATGGIGFAIARHFATAGHKVVLADLQQELGLDLEDRRLRQLILLARQLAGPTNTSRVDTKMPLPNRGNAASLANSSKNSCKPIDVMAITIKSEYLTAISCSGLSNWPGLTLATPTPTSASDTKAMPRSIKRAVAKDALLSIKLCCSAWRACVSSGANNGFSARCCNTPE